MLRQGEWSFSYQLRKPKDHSLVWLEWEMDGRECPKKRLNRLSLNFPKMAERTGFEPVEDLLDLHRFSKPAHSTTLPSLLKFERWAYRMASDEVNPKDQASEKGAGMARAFGRSGTPKGWPFGRVEGRKDAHESKRSTQHGSSWANQCKRIQAILQNWLWVFFS